MSHINLKHLIKVVHSWYKPNIPAILLYFCKECYAINRMPSLHIENTEEANPVEETVVDELESRTEFRVSEMPTLSDMKALARVSKALKVECGVQLNSSGETPYTAYCRGTKTHIYHPRVQGRYNTVFFHTHPGEEIGRLPTSIAVLTPSFVTERYSQYNKRDVGALDLDLNGGGAMNIISETGITFCVGTLSHSSESIATTKARRVLRMADTTSTPLLFVMSGPREGEVIDNFSDETYDSDYVGDEQSVCFVIRVPSKRVDYVMVFSSFETLERNNVDVPNLCFGDGVSRLLTSENIAVPHSNNLYAALHATCGNSTI